MVTFNFDLIIDQTITFFPNNDNIGFGFVSASQVTLTENEIATGVFNTVISTNAGSVTLANTQIGNLTLSNLFFSDGSVMAIGDRTSDAAADDNADTLDFNADVALGSAVTRNNQLFGLGGADTIDAGSTTGNNLIFGGDGDDAITAGSGINTIYGGSGTQDTSDGGDTITLGNRTSLVYGNAGADTIGFNSPVLNETNTSIFGGAGADVINAPAALGALYVAAGTEGDTVNLVNSSGAHTVLGGAGGDTIDASGSLGALTLFGGTSTIDSNDDGDQFVLGRGSSLVYGNAGADTVTLNADAGQTAAVYFGSGSDSATSAANFGSYNLIAGLGGDTIDLTGHAGNATIIGGNGQVDAADDGDTLTGGVGGHVLIYGNGGGDVLSVSPAANRVAEVYGGANDDTINAAPQDRSSTLNLNGNLGNDAFNLDFSTSPAVANLIDFGIGDDTIATTLSGGDATTLIIERGESNTTVRNGGEEQMMLGQFTGNFTAENFVISDSSLLLTNFNGEADTLTGSDNNDQIRAGENGDSIVAGAGMDLIIGGAGADTISINSADISNADTINGGAGADTLLIGTPAVTASDIFFANVRAIETLALDTGDFSANGLALGAQAAAAGIRTIDASAASSANVDLSGMTAGITYNGATGDDTVIGTVNADVINGDAGDDVISASLGADTLTGGDGNDVFSYFAADGVADIEGNDTITDFDAGTALDAVDTFRFSAGPNNYDLGNTDAAVDGAIISSITSAGGPNTELVILTNVGIATQDITTSLNTINNFVQPTRGMLDVFYDTTKGHAVIYYDNNGSTVGGHNLVANLTNITDIADMTNFNFNDFVFI